MSHSRLASVLAALTAVLASAGCESRAARTYRMTFVSTVDGRRPLAHARVSSRGIELGRTGDDGRLVVELSGHRGERVPVSAECPEGYRTFSAPESVRLERYDALEQGSILEHSIECRPTERQVVLVVSAGVETELPVLVDGVEEATTEDGVAHVLVERPPGSTLSVRIDTSVDPDLLPASPTRLFEIADRDELLLFAPPLSRPAPAPPRRPSVPKRSRPVPYRID